MLTLQNIYDDIYAKTGLTTNDVATTVLLPFINQRLSDLYSTVVEVNEDFLGTTTTTSMTSGEGTFALPSTLMKIKRVEITNDGTQWYEAQPIDLNEITSATDVTSVKADFSTAEPRYELFGTEIELLPPATASVTNGFKMWYIAKPSDLSATTDTPNIALQGFEHLVSAGTIQDVANLLELQQLGQAYSQRWEQGIKDMRRQLQNRSLEENLAFSKLDENYG